jgi:hypothetical protein
VARLALWGVLVAIVLLGLYLYFRHQRATTPLLGSAAPVAAPTRAAVARPAAPQVA